LKTKVLLGLSGGVDSAVSAFLLKKDGYDVEAVYMILHNNQNYHQKNIKIVKQVSEFLDIKYHILDLSDKFSKNVYNPFIDAYKDGITPNPCVTCNKTIKFGAMYDFMKKINAQYLATGHYVKTDGKFIYEALDLTKDQSYFLAQVNQDVLKHLIFPLNNLTKNSIREIAKDISILKELAQQKESQEICFVENNYIDILNEHFDVNKKGDVLNSQGKIIGEHKGYMHYTIGKRKGFQVFIAHDPHYVISQNKDNNTITVGKKDELKINKVIVTNLNLFTNKNKFKAGVKLRYRTKKIDANIKIDGNKAIIELSENAFGVAFGQIAVFYDKNKIIGSGTIIETSYQNKSRVIQN